MTASTPQARDLPSPPPQNLTPPIVGRRRKTSRKLYPIRSLNKLTDTTTVGEPHDVKKTIFKCFFTDGAKVLISRQAL